MGTKVTEELSLQHKDNLLIYLKIGKGYTMPSALGRIGLRSLEVWGANREELTK
jgi:hypothetical protein